MTTIPVDKMMNETEDESAVTLAGADGRCCYICGVIKKKVDFPFSLRKIQTECRACLLFQSNGSIDTRDDDSTFVSFQYPQQHYQQKPQFVLIHGAEIV
jgi:hypothetical protein